MKTKKRILILGLIILIISIVAMTHVINNRNEDEIKIWKHGELQVKYISENIEEVKEILESTQYIDKNLDLHNEDFKIWLEKDIPQVFSIWITNDRGIIIFNKNTGKYGDIMDNNALILKAILNQYTKK
jgi:hypothetical protein